MGCCSTPAQSVDTKSKPQDTRVGRSLSPDSARRVRTCTPGGQRSVVARRLLGGLPATLERSCTAGVGAVAASGVVRLEHVTALGAGSFDQWQFRPLPAWRRLWRVQSHVHSAVVRGVVGGEDRRAVVCCAGTTRRIERDLDAAPASGREPRCSVGHVSDHGRDGAGLAKAADARQAERQAFANLQVRSASGTNISVPHVGVGRGDTRRRGGARLERTCRCRRLWSQCRLGLTSRARRRSASA